MLEFLLSDSDVIEDVLGVSFVCNSSVTENFSERGGGPDLEGFNKDCGLFMGLSVFDKLSEVLAGSGWDLSSWDVFTRARSDFGTDKVTKDLEVFIFEPVRDSALTLEEWIVIKSEIEVSTDEVEGIGCLILIVLNE